MSDRKGICFEIFSNGVGVILFGSTGNLARKKIIPSLCNLFNKEYIRENFFVLNVGSKDFNDETFRNYLKEVLYEKNITDIDSFIERNYYYRIDYSSKLSFNKMHQRFEEIEKFYSNEFKNRNRIYYLSIPPSGINQSLENIKEFVKENEYSKIVIEKPFASDFYDALILNEYIRENNIEDKIYRIDHYLGKNSVINIHLVKNLNFIFQKTFNNNFIDNIQLTVYEDEGIENRVSFYDGFGAFKDMITHIFQILSFIMMEPVSDFSYNSIRKSKIDFLKSIVLPDKSFADRYFLFAQYEGYKNILGVKHLNTETFFAIRLDVKNNSWRGVPVYIKSGKKMKEKITRVDIKYKELKTELSEKFAFEDANLLSFVIQPQKIMRFDFNAKADGAKFCISRHSWIKEFETKLIELSDYERLLLDIINGDKTLFLSDEEMKYIWCYIKAVEDFMRDRVLVIYKEGLLPEGVDEICLKDGRKWIFV